MLKEESKFTEALTFCPKCRTEYFDPPTECDWCPGVSTRLKENLNVDKRNTTQVVGFPSRNGSGEEVES